MQVTSGSDWLAPGGVNRRTWHITLDMTDGERIAGEEWHDWTWTRQRAFLQFRADLEVLRYMYTEDAISQDFLKERATKLKANYDEVVESGK